MPSPLSTILISFMPDSSMNTSISSAFASREFSISSLTTELGRSTTSPAAILFCIFGSSTLIEDISSLAFQSVFHLVQFQQRIHRRQIVYIRLFQHIDNRMILI